MSDAFICKALRGAAVVFYCKSLITQQMGASGNARRVKNFHEISRLFVFMGIRPMRMGMDVLMNMNVLIKKDFPVFQCIDGICYLV